MSFGGKQKELVANNLTAPLHDHVILKTLNACFKLFLIICLDVPETPRKKLILMAKEGSDYDITSNTFILENL